MPWPRLLRPSGNTQTAGTGMLVTSQPSIPIGPKNCFLVKSRSFPLSWGRSSSKSFTTSYVGSVSFDPRFLEGRSAKSAFLLHARAVLTYSDLHGARRTYCDSHAEEPRHHCRRCIKISTSDEKEMSQGNHWFGSIKKTHLRDPFNPTTVCHLFKGCLCSCSSVKRPFKRPYRRRKEANRISPVLPAK